MKEIREVSKEEAAKINPAEIGKGVSVTEGEVEAQGYTITCGKCGHKFYIHQNFRYTICPSCGLIKEWSY